MALPKIDLPVYELELPSTGEKIKYRPYTVKEEKILLVAQESKEASQEILAMKQVVNNCLIDKDIEELAMFDLEYIHLALRAKSVDNNISFAINDPETEERVDLSLDLDTVELKRIEGHTNEVKINEDYILYLKYPTIDSFLTIVSMRADDPLINYFIITSCLDKIASEDEVYYFKDYSGEEIDAFMDGLNGSIVAQIQNFFDTMPRIRHTVKYVNKNGNEKTWVLEGTRSFFE